MSWLQFNAQLLRLTGEARFADSIEQAVLNQLLAAQRPDGAAWGSYTQLEGTRRFSAALDGNCCLSSGPRGIALIPTFALTTDGDGVVVNLFEAGAAHLTLRDGTRVGVTVATRYPADGRVRVTLRPESAHEFSLKLRVPAWCRRHELRPTGEHLGADGYATLRRRWRPGDTVELRLTLEPRQATGDHMNEGKAALLYGPLVLAADESLLGTAGPLSALVLPEAGLPALAVTPRAAPASVATWPGSRGYRIRAASRRVRVPVSALLLPFADAGPAARASRCGCRSRAARAAICCWAGSRAARARATAAAPSSTTTCAAWW